MQQQQGQGKRRRVGLQELRDRAGGEPWEEGRAAWLGRVGRESEGVAYEQRTDELLRLELERRGLSTRGVREVLLHRLQRSDEGREALPAMPSQLLQQQQQQQGHEQQQQGQEEHRQQHRLQLAAPAPRYGKGADAFLGMPRHLLRHLLAALDLASLLAMSACCRLLNHEAKPLLLARAVHLFGEGATLMAVACTVFYEASKLSFTKLNSRLRSQLRLHNLDVHPVPDDLRDKKALIHMRIREAIMHHGSVENVKRLWLQQRAHNALLLEEMTVLQDGVANRLDDFNAQSGKAGLGRIALLRDGGQSVELDSLLLLLLSDAEFKSLSARISKHVLRKEPSRAASVLTRITDPRYGPILASLRRVGAASACEEPRLSFARARISLFQVAEGDADALWLCGTRLATHAELDVCVRWAVTVRPPPAGSALISLVEEGRIPPADTCVVSANTTYAGLLTHLQLQPADVLSHNGSRFDYHALRHRTLFSLVLLQVRRK